MLAKAMNPILNVSSVVESIKWFEKLGWQKGFEWGDPPDFGSVCSGNYAIFLCEDGQGSRGKSNLAMTFGPNGNDRADKGVWVSVWVDDVEAVYQHCLTEGIEVTWPPTDMPWNVREMH